MCDTDLIDAYDLAENGRGAEIRARLSRWWHSAAVPKKAGQRTFYINGLSCRSISFRDRFE